MEELKNTMVKVQVGDCTLGITKGYGYTNKENKHRYTYNETYYVEDGKVSRKYSNERGEHFYNIDLVDVVVETFPMKDGTMGSKTYPLSDVPYLAPDSDHVDEAVLKDYSSFKLHR